MWCELSMVSSCGLLQPVSMKKTAPIERIAAVAICRRLTDARRQIYCFTVKRPMPGLRALPPMTAQIATALGPALDEPGALQQPSTVILGRAQAERGGSASFSDNRH